MNTPDDFIPPPTEEEDRIWDELLARPESKALLKEWHAEVLAEDDAGLTEELDPDTLPD